MLVDDEASAAKSGSSGSNAGAGGGGGGGGGGGAVGSTGLKTKGQGGAKSGQRATKGSAKRIAIEERRK